MISEFIAHEGEDTLLYKLKIVNLQRNPINCFFVIVKRRSIIIHFHLHTGFSDISGTAQLLSEAAAVKVGIQPRTSTDSVDRGGQFPLGPGRSTVVCLT